MQVYISIPADWKRVLLSTPPAILTKIITGSASFNTNLEMDSIVISVKTFVLIRRAPIII